MTSDSPDDKVRMPQNIDFRPQARHKGLVVQSLTAELLVYDLERHRAHCLNQTATHVWHLCDGKSSVAEIAKQLGGDMEASVADSVVWHALDQLGRGHLLEEAVPVSAGRGSVSRRTFLRKAAAIGGISIMAPVVLSVLAPLPAQAASGNPALSSCIPVGNVCEADFQCCPNSIGIKNCKQNICQ